MSLPAPPASPPAQEPFQWRSLPRRSPLRVAVAVGAVACVLLAGGLTVQLLASTPTSPAGVDTPPPAPQPVTLTQEVLDKELATAVFFLGRGQVQGASQIITDALAGTTCGVVEQGWGPFATKAEAKQADIGWREAARPLLGPEALLAGAFARAEDPKAVGGAWVAASIAVMCA